MKSHLPVWIAAGAAVGAIAAFTLLLITGPSDVPQSAQVPTEKEDDHTPARASSPTAEKAPRSGVPFAILPKVPEVMTIEHVATRSRPESRDLALKDLLWAGIAADAPKTLEAIRHLESPVLREELERRALHIWTESDPAAAVAWAHAIPDTAESSQALDAICTQMSESDPRVALEALIDADDGQSSMALIENVAGRWASEDFDTARHWAEIQDDGPVRDRLIQRIAFARVGDDPVAAATLVATQIPPGAEQEEAIIAILHQWAIQDVTAAEEWVHAFPAGPVRDRAIREIQSMRLSQTTASAN